MHTSCLLDSQSCHPRSQQNFLASFHPQVDGWSRLNCPWNWDMWFKLAWVPTHQAQRCLFRCPSECTVPAGCPLTWWLSSTSYHARFFPEEMSCISLLLWAVWADHSYKATVSHKESKELKQWIVIYMALLGWLFFSLLLWDIYKSVWAEKSLTWWCWWSALMCLYSLSSLALCSCSSTEEEKVIARPKSMSRFCSRDFVSG